MAKCKPVSDESVLSTLHRGGEGQNVYRMIFSNPCDQGCSFFSNYFFRFKKCITWSFAFNVSKRNILLSGDVELNPGPVADGRISSSTLVCKTTPKLLLSSRLLRHGLRALDVGGGGDCFFNHTSYVVTQTVT